MKDRQCLDAAINMTQRAVDATKEDDFKAKRISVA
jgi:hypothetical protein